ncbi:hypothetical protein HK104_011341 [Borealophlyctis nickersoniae]|nr:hypothetical protein HK104_011341 [Borealophlyctis nickersoniae]
MVLHNFKSYAGKVEIGPFHKSFTSIVGPNGSGKSNVIDSLLFVFGFKAKKMRQGKLSELIHNSTHFQNLTSCTVEVHFREIIDLPGPDAFDVVEGSELVISRTVEKGLGEKAADKSTYRINGRASNFTEVTQLLKNKGVDLDHKRFLILQGEVESISLMKPKAQNEHEDGLLEYLEDIIGTSSYKQPIEDANTALDQLNEERAEKLNRLKIVEKDKKGLESKKEEAVDFINTENELTRRKNELYQIHIVENEKDAAKHQEAMETFTAQLDEEKEKYAELLTEIKSMEKDYNAVQKDYDEVANKAEAVRKDLQKFDRAEIELREKEKHLSAKQKKLTKTLQAERLTRSEHETWMQNFDSDLNKANEEAETLAERMAVEEAKLEEIRESLKGKTEVFQVKIEKKQQELAPWAEKINEKQASLDVAQSEHDILKNKIESAKSGIIDAETELARLRNSSVEKIEEAQRLDSLKKELSRNIQDVKQNLEGRLGDLGVIDDKYDVAITTACPGLNGIVVETVEAGQKCIEFLKQQNLGRASFFCLDKIRKHDVSPIQTPEGVPRLFDLVKLKDPKYAIVFYETLKDTLVAENLQQANRIAFGAGKRYRVVTLDGKLIDTSGTMSGGGAKPQRGGMSSKFAAADIDAHTAQELEQSRDELERQLASLLEEGKRLEKELESLTAQLPSVEMDLAKATMEAQSVTKAIEDAEKHLSDLKKQNRQPDIQDIRRIEELTRTIAVYDVDIEKLRKSSSKIEDEIKELQNQILEVGGDRLRSQKARVDIISNQIDTVQTSITKLHAERTTREKALTKVAAGITKKESEMEETERALETVRDDLEKQVSSAREAKQRVQEVKEILSAKEAELSEMKAVLDEKTEVVNEMRKREVEVKVQLDKARELYNLKTREVKGLQKAIDKLELQKTGFEEEEEEEELPKFTREELETLDIDSIKNQMGALEAKLSKGTPNLGVLAEYKQKLDIYLSRAKDLEEITQARDDAKKTHDDLRNRRLAQFMEGFSAISQKLKEMYQMITLGGNAELELVDSLDPFSEGIIFSVMPPKKSWKNISNLSGGEKTLSSLALVFALHHFKPTPLYVMDEIDAALDFRNVSIVANYIKERTKNGQFVIISLRNNMFELADRLVGIYKTDNTTKSIAINPAAIAC